MLRAYRNILEKIKKNGFSFYCLPAVLCLSACCGFVFSVTVQAVSFVALVVCAAVIVTKNKFKNIELLFVFLPLAAVFLSYLGADFQANVRDASLGLVNAALAFFIMLYADNKNKENVFLVLLFLGLWVSFLVLIRFFTGVDIEEQSAFLNINIVSGFLLLVYPLALGFVEKNKYPAFFLFAALVIVFSIMITQSRAAIVLSYAVTAFYFMRLGKNKNFRIFFIIVSTAAAVGIVYAFYMKTGWNSFSERFVWWKTAWLMFKDNPVFGAGFGNYGALFLYYRPEYVLNTLFAHNIFLQILAETGIVGIISFAAAFYFMAKNALQSFKNKSADSIYMKSAAVGIIIFLIFNITEYSFYIPVCLTTFFVLCGFLCRIEIEKRKSRFTFWIIIIAVLVSVYTAVLPVIAEQYYKIGKKSAAAKNYENAKEQYLKAVKYDAKNPEYLHQAADCSFKLYVLSFQTEKSYLEETIDLELHSEKFYVHSAQIKSGIANLYSLKGDLQNAEKYTEAARKFDKFNPNYGNMQ